jgi:hypothetical protein
MLRNIVILEDSFPNLMGAIAYRIAGAPWGALWQRQWMAGTVRVQWPKNLLGRGNA